MQGSQAPAPVRGVLGVPGRLPFRLRRVLPPPDLAWCVAHYWESSWRLPPGRAVVARVLPHAAVNLTLEQGRLIVTGIPAGVFSRRLVGVDDAFGIRFAPGAFRLLGATPIRELTGAGQPASEVLAGAGALAEALRAAAPDDRPEAATAWLRGLDVEPDTTLVLVQSAFAALVSDPAVRRVQQVADRLGVSSRTLQRAFASYVGVSPGWVLRRGRLHEAAERVMQGAVGGDAVLADVAAEFGYADQAHFVHEFRRELGAPPSTWLAELVAEQPA